MNLKNLKKSPPGKYFWFRYLSSNFTLSPFSEPSSHPAIPSFCHDLGDNTEVILKGCIVRDNRVFIKGKLIRPLNSLERETVNKLLVARSPAYTPHTLLFERKKREAGNETELSETAEDKKDKTEAVKDVHNDVANFLENFLKVNSTVAKRFLPVAKMSPLLNELSDGVAAAAAANSKENERKQILFRFLTNEN